MYNVNSINIVINDDSKYLHQSLKSMLNQFVNLSKIYIENNSFQLTKKQVNRLVDSINNPYRKITLYINSAMIPSSLDKIETIAYTIILK